MGHFPVKTPVPGPPDLSDEERQKKKDAELVAWVSDLFSEEEDSLIFPGPVKNWLGELLAAYDANYRDPAKTIEQVDPPGAQVIVITPPPVSTYGFPRFVARNVYKARIFLANLAEKTHKINRAAFLTKVFNNPARSNWFPPVIGGVGNFFLDPSDQYLSASDDSGEVGWIDRFPTASYQTTLDEIKAAISWLLLNNGKDVDIFSIEDTSTYGYVNADGNFPGAGFSSPSPRSALPVLRDARIDLAQVPPGGHVQLRLSFTITAKLKNREAITLSKLAILTSLSISLFKEGDTPDRYSLLGEAGEQLITPAAALGFLESVITRDKTLTNRTNGDTPVLLLYRHAYRAIPPNFIGDKQALLVTYFPTVLLQKLNGELLTLSLADNPETEKDETPSFTLYGTGTAGGEGGGPTDSLNFEIILLATPGLVGPNEASSLHLTVTVFRGKIDGKRATLFWDPTGLSGPATIENIIVLAGSRTFYSPISAPASLQQENDRNFTITATMDVDGVIRSAETHLTLKGTKTPVVKDSFEISLAGGPSSVYLFRGKSYTFEGVYVSNNSTGLPEVSTPLNFTGASTSGTLEAIGPFGRGVVFWRDYVIPASFPNRVSVSSTAHGTSSNTLEFEVKDFGVVPPGGCDPNAPWIQENKVRALRAATIPEKLTLSGVISATLDSVSFFLYNPSLVGARLASSPPTTILCSRRNKTTGERTPYASLPPAEPGMEIPAGATVEVKIGPLAVAVSDGFGTNVWPEFELQAVIDHTGLCDELTGEVGDGGKPLVYEIPPIRIVVPLVAAGTALSLFLRSVDLVYTRFGQVRYVEVIYSNSGAVPITVLEKDLVFFGRDDSGNIARVVYRIVPPPTGLAAPWVIPKKGGGEILSGTTDPVLFLTPAETGERTYQLAVSDTKVIDTSLPNSTDTVKISILDAVPADAPIAKASDPFLDCLPGQIKIFTGSVVSGTADVLAWEIKALPPGSSASLTPLPVGVATLRPDVPGFYVLTFSAKNTTLGMISEDRTFAFVKGTAGGTTLGTTPRPIAIAGRPGGFGGGTICLANFPASGAFRVITLDGTRSRNPEGLGLTYSWRIVEGSDAFLRSPTSDHPDLLIPEAFSRSRYQIGLVVEGTTAVKSEESILEFFPRPAAPIFGEFKVSAGTEATAHIDETVTLDSSKTVTGSGVLPPTRASWVVVSQPSGPPDSPVRTPPPFIGDPEVWTLTLRKGGTYVVKVSIATTDAFGSGISIAGFDHVIFSVLDTHAPPLDTSKPVAIAGAGRAVKRGDVTILDGRRSWDPDSAVAPSTLVYRWKRVSGGPASDEPGRLVTLLGIVIPEIPPASGITPSPGFYLYATLAGTTGSNELRFDRSLGSGLFVDLVTAEPDYVTIGTGTVITAKLHHSESYNIKITSLTAKVLNGAVQVGATVNLGPLPTDIFPGRSADFTGIYTPPLTVAVDTDCQILVEATGVSGPDLYLAQGTGVLTITPRQVAYAIDKLFFSPVLVYTTPYGITASMADGERAWIVVEAHLKPGFAVDGVVYLAGVEETGPAAEKFTILFPAMCISVVGGITKLTGRLELNSGPASGSLSPKISRIRVFVYDSAGFKVSKPTYLPVERTGISMKPVSLVHTGAPLEAYGDPLSPTITLKNQAVFSPIDLRNIVFSPYRTAVVLRASRIVSGNPVETYGEEEGDSDIVLAIGATAASKVKRPIPIKAVGPVKVRANSLRINDFRVLSQDYKDVDRGIGIGVAYNSPFSTDLDFTLKELFTLQLVSVVPATNPGSSIFRTITFTAKNNTNLTSIDVVVFSQFVGNVRVRVSPGATQTLSANRTTTLPMTLSVVGTRVDNSLDRTVSLIVS